MSKISVLVININNLKYTRDCVNDLLLQTIKTFNITLVDQGSTEEGTEEYLEFIEMFDSVKVIRNQENRDIHTIWNEFQENENSQYLCYLNNDVRLTVNFIEDTIKILDNDNTVGIVVHATNNFRYNKRLFTTEYRFTERKIKQGWDFTIRKELYTPIPNTLHLYFGDDWLFHNVYLKEYKVATCISSPIIHYGSKSLSYSSWSSMEEEKTFNAMGLQRYLPHYSEYTDVVPTYLEFNDKPIKIYVYPCKDKTKIIEKGLEPGENSKVSPLNAEMLKEYGEKMENVSQYHKDMCKIMLSVEICDALEKGKDYVVLHDYNFNYTLPIYMEYLNDPIIIS